MNLIHLIGSLEGFESSEDPAYDMMVYAFILSDTFVSGKHLCAKVTVRSLEKFEHQPVEDIKEGIEFLTKAGLIRKKGVAEYIVGNVSDDGNYELLHPDGFTDSEVSLKREYEEADNLVAAYTTILRKMGRHGQAEDITDSLNDFKAIPLPKKENKHVAEYYRLLQEAYYQEVPPRNFTAAERGQFKHLINYYGIGVSLKMVHEFITQATKYAKKGLSVGLLLYHKDTLYATVTGKTNINRTTEVRTGKHKADRTDRWLE